MLVTHSKTVSVGRAVVGAAMWAAASRVSEDLSKRVSHFKGVGVT